MIDGLIAGRLYGKPAERTAKNGNRFATAKVRVTAGNGEALFVNVIAFADSAVTALLALSDGNARPTLDLVAHGVLTAYHVNRRRRAITEDAA